jgi:hypothetical protein
VERCTDFVVNYADGAPYTHQNCEPVLA